MYINKKVVARAIIIIIIIVLAIISVNVRIGDKMEKESEQFIGYEPDDGIEGQIVGDEPDNTILSIYDFDKIMPYFEKFEDSLLFKDYLNDYIVANGSKVQEWWIKDITFDSSTLTLTFNVKSKYTSESYYISKNNEGTFIERSINAEEIK